MLAIAMHPELDGVGEPDGEGELAPAPATVLGVMLTLAELVVAEHTATYFPFEELGLELSYVRLAPLRVPSAATKLQEALF